MARYIYCVRTREMHLQIVYSFAQNTVHEMLTGRYGTVQSVQSNGFTVPWVSNRENDRGQGSPAGHARG